MLDLLTKFELLVKLYTFYKRWAQEIAGGLDVTEATNTQTAMIRGRPTTLLLLDSTKMDDQAVKQIACLWITVKASISF